MRANAAVARKDDTGRATRSDLVMHALYALARDRRHEEREAVLQREGRRWLAAQGERAGFRLGSEEENEDEPAVRFDGYDVWRFPRLGRTGGIAVFDATDVLEVTDAALFLTRLAQGLGRARSFGCGLMLIRRA